MNTVTRPALRYHGGKWKLAPWIVSHFPAHRFYVEPYGGAASVLLRKPRAYSEIYNDLDGEVVNLFRVLRNPADARELIRLLTYTPYSRQEFEDSQLLAGDPIELARRTVVRSFLGYGSTAATSNTGFRTGARKTGSAAAMDWRRLPDCLHAVVDRLRGVTIENRPALDVLRQYDADDALHYVDPPYPRSTRNIHSASNAIYRYEMTDEEHRHLADTLRQLRGMVIVSGYGCDLYDQELYPDWHRLTRNTHADGGGDRTEVLWISPSAVRQPDLFGGM